MVTLVVYDISENSKRQEVEKICKDNGLIRVQKSVFRGNIDSNHRKKLIEAMTIQSVEQIKSTWDVQIYLISKDDFESHIHLRVGGPGNDIIEDSEVIFI